MDPGLLWPVITVLGAALLGVGIAYGMMRSAPDGRRKSRFLIPAVAGVILLLGGIFALTINAGSDETPALAAGAAHVVDQASSEELAGSVVADTPDRAGRVTSPEVAQQNGRAGSGRTGPGAG